MQLGHRSLPGSARSSSGRKRRFKHLNIEQGINNNNNAPGRHLVVISINITRSVMATPPHRQAANYPLLPPDTPASTEPAKRRNSIISDFVFSVGEFKSLRPAASRAQRSADTASLGRTSCSCSASAELFVCSDVPVLYNVSSRQRNIHLTKLRELRAADLLSCIPSW